MSSRPPLSVTPRPLKIVQVFNRYLLPGGEENSVVRMAEDLESAGHQVTRFWRESAEWIGPAAPPRWKQPLLLWCNPPVLAQLRRTHESVKADLWLLHNVLPVVSLGIYRLALKLQVPVVQWLHNYRPISAGGTLFAAEKPLLPEDRWIYWRETLAGSWNSRILTGWLSLSYWRLKQRGDFNSVRAWVAVSEAMRRIFARADWFCDKLYSVPHSWHVQSPAVSTADEGHLVFLGRMIETKGVRFLVNLWQHPALRDRQLVMAGQGPLADELRPQSPPNIRWVGHVEGAMKKKLLAECRALLFPCVWAEPLSTVVYEGYELGKPILASSLGGMTEMIVDQQTGRLLPPADEAAWLRAIQDLDAATAQRWGRQGRRWLEENGSPDAWNRKFSGIIERALR